MKNEENKKTIRQILSEAITEVERQHGVRITEVGVSVYNIEIEAAL